MTKSLFATLTLGLLLTVGNAAAASISFTGGFGWTPTALNESITLPGFDTSLGTLTSITFSLTGQTQGSATVTNNSGIVSPYSVDLFTNLTLLNPLNAEILSNNPTFSTILIINDGESGTATGTSPATTIDQTIFSGFGLYLDPTVTFTVTGDGLATASGPTPYSVTATAMGQADLTVTYNYSTPSEIPEPAAVGLLGAGLLGIGWIRRKATV